MSALTTAYTFSPRVVVIAGPPAAGKSTLAQRICKQFDCASISLDAINSTVAHICRCDIAALSTESPEINTAFSQCFIQRIREVRYKDIVIEGCRISHPHIFTAFVDALYKCYGEYVFLDCFYLLPPDEIRQKYYMLRQARLFKEYVRQDNADALRLLRQEQEKGYCHYLEPVLVGFHVVENSEVVLASVEKHTGRTHPLLPTPHKGLLKAIAESGTFNPFYQRVEVDGRLVIRGFTDSEISWQAISRFGVPFAGKTLCDVGCMHGYFSFKAEEQGAQVLGVDIDAGAIAAARHVATARASSCRFEVGDITRGFENPFDIILVLNVLHRVDSFKSACEAIFTSADQLLLEAGETQLPELMTVAGTYGFVLANTQSSHRNSSVIGQRALYHFQKMENLF